MAFEKLNNIPSEILIRFGHGAEHQIKAGVGLGDFSGAQFKEATCFRDTDTGEISHYEEGDAQVLPKEKIAEYLGDKFIAFETQLREATDRADAADKAARAATAELEDAMKKLAETEASRTKLQASLQEVSQLLGAAQVVAAA